MATAKGLDPRLVEIEFKNDFSADELKLYRELFVKYDVNKSGELELFELNVMYEEMKQPKTNLQLRALIQEADTSNSGGIDYREFLNVLLKDKKGISKGPWKGFGTTVAKHHDETKASGKLANFFESEIAKQNDQSALQQEQLRLQREDKIAKEKEKERKKKVQEGLAKLKAGINGN